MSEEKAGVQEKTKKCSEKHWKNQKKRKNVKKWAQKQKNDRRIFQNLGECKRMLGEELNLPKISKIDVAKL